MNNIENEIERILNNPEKANIKLDFLFLIKKEKLEFAINALKQLNASMIMIIYSSSNFHNKTQEAVMKEAEDRWKSTVWAKNIKLQIEGLETELDTW